MQLLRGLGRDRRGIDPILETFADIELVLPRGLALAGEERESIASPIPDAAPTVETHRRYRADGAELHLFHWDGPVLRDGGVMAGDETWTVEIAGRAAKMIRTRVFLGHERRVLVTHFGGNTQDRYMIYTDDLDTTSFETMLSTIRFI